METNQNFIGEAIRILERVDEKKKVLQSNLIGSNIFGIMEIRSKHE